MHLKQEVTQQAITRDHLRLQHTSGGSRGSVAYAAVKYRHSSTTRAIASRGARGGGDDRVLPHQRQDVSRRRVGINSHTGTNVAARVFRFRAKVQQQRHATAIIHHRLKDLARDVFDRWEFMLDVLTPCVEQVLRSRGKCWERLS